MGHLREWIPGGNFGTAATISRMRDLVSQGKRDFRIRQLVGDIIHGKVNGVPGCPAKDYYCYANAAHLYCRDVIRYVFDPNGVEMIEEPWKIVESGIADCDSIVVLMAALCETMGFPCRFVTIKADMKRPEDFSHVFLEVRIPGRGWVGSDPTQPQHPFGWAPPAKFPRKSWPASNDEDEVGKESDPMAGLGQLSPEPEVEWIPGVQATPGVAVGHTFSFRDEPALVTTRPEEMELDPFNAPAENALVPMPGLRDEFFLAPQDDLELSQQNPLPPSAPSAPMGRMGSTAGIPGWAWIGGALFLLYFLGKKN